VNQLTSWLRTMDLEDYAPLFESHGVDLRSLPLLTERDLSELGVLLGHRKLLLKAIATLEGEQSDSVKPVLSAHDGERRQLTVLFCDLVDSTGLAQRLDPEALRESMRNYQQTCGEVVKRFYGHIAQYLGDGLVVYFGWPQANEDDAERAVRAALEIVPAVSALAGPERLRVRIGIATGLVVVGAEGAGDASVPGAAVGETPNLAARLQQLAEPGEIVIAPSTHRLVGRTFDVDALGDRSLRGITGPVRPQRVLGLARAESRFWATRGGRYTPFVGRENEVALLLARWQQAREGEGQVVLLAGEPGIGKSRIAQVLRERLTDTPHMQLHFQCSPYHTGSAFFPLIEQIEQAAGFERNDAAQQRLEKLEALLDPGAEELAVIAPLFAALLSLPVDRYPPRMLSPQKHRELTIAALVGQLIQRARRQPLLMVLEDAQWIDPSTLETIALMVESMRHAAILLVITCRLTFVPAWGGRGNVSMLNLNRLSKLHGGAIAASLTAGKALPAEVLAQLLECADGVPLFIEELTTTVLELGLLNDMGDRYELSAPLPHLAIPATLHDSLMARLDRLGWMKEVAQVGACIGREFDQELLATVSPVSGAELQDALDKLVRSGLVARRDSDSRLTYRFKHALVRDVAYDGLLKSRRQQIHGAIARALSHDFKERTRAQPELLALHLTYAGLIDQALLQWRAAVRWAIANHRHREALGYVDAGLALVDKASVDIRANQQVGLLAAGAACHWVVTGYGCRLAADLSARAETLLEAVTDRRLLILSLAGGLIGAYVGADTAKAVAIAERLVSLGQTTSNTDERVIAFASASTVLAHQGQFERSRRLLEFVVENYQTDRRFAHGRINDSKAHACAWLSWIHATTGRLTLAKHYARIAIEHAMAIAEPFVLSQALSVGALSFAEAGDCDEALALCQRCMELCSSQNVPFWRGWATVHEGVALAGQGEHQRAEIRFGEAIAFITANGGRNNLGYVYARRTQALAALGRYDEARREYEVGRTECLQTGQLLMLTELGYARGLTEGLDPDASTEAAERWLGIALAHARSSGMGLVELRAAMALAKVWKSQDKGQAARALLEPICERFNDESDGADLTSAKALLDELNA
jgi:class 3 adenylate cyclase/tetratricopeptide (TPR) repeat protein